MTSQIEEKYDSKFSQEEIDLLTDLHFPQEIAKRYPKRFNGYQSYILHNAGCSPEESKKYSLGVDCIEIAAITRFDASPELLEQELVSLLWDEIQEGKIKIKEKPPVKNFGPDDYPETVSGSEIKYLSSKGISPEDVRKYDKRFHDELFIIIGEFYCPPEKANSYDKQMGPVEIGFFSLKNIPNELAARFLETEEGDKKKIKVFKEGISSAGEISLCMRTGTLPSKLFGTSEYVLPGYKVHADFLGIPQNAMKKAGLMSIKNHEGESKTIMHIKEYYYANDPKKKIKRDYEFETIELRKKVIHHDLPEENPEALIDEALREKYGSRFSENELHTFLHLRIPPEIVKAYPEHIKGLQIISLYYYTQKDPKDLDFSLGFSELERKINDEFRQNNSGQTERKKQRYLPRFRKPEAFKVVKTCPPEEANQYDRNFSPEDILLLYQNGIPAIIANNFEIAKPITSWEERLKTETFSELRAEKIIDSIRKGTYGPVYDPRLSAKQIEYLEAMNVPAPASFLIDRKIEPFIEHKKTIDAYIALMLESLNVPVETVKSRRFDNLYPQLKNAMLYLASQGVDPFSKETGCFSLGAGNRGIVVHSGGKAIKFSPHIEKEARLLKKIKNSHHVVRAESGLIELQFGNNPPSHIIELEYIQGQTLEKIMKARGDIPPSIALKYMYDMLCGLTELREVGIYHTDLHDRNVMIKTHENKKELWEPVAIIIDLDAATENPGQINPLNRKYGGNNDLISLGCLGYRMVQGINPFNESYETTQRSEIKGRIKTRREEVYENDLEKALFLGSLETDVKDEDCASVLFHLLKGELWVQPDFSEVLEAKKMFEGVLGLGFF